MPDNRTCLWCRTRTTAPIQSWLSLCPSWSRPVWCLSFVGKCGVRSEWTCPAGRTWAASSLISAKLGVPVLLLLLAHQQTPQIRSASTPGLCFQMSKTTCVQRQQGLTISSQTCKDHYLQKGRDPLGRDPERDFIPWASAICQRMKIRRRVQSRSPQKPWERAATWKEMLQVNKNQKRQTAPHQEQTLRLMFGITRKR